MRVLQINVVYPYGSTGRICEGIYNECLRQGIECKNAFAYSSHVIKDGIPITTSFDNHIHNRLARLTMLEGCFSYYHTRLFLKKVEEYDPDIIHLHNIHGNFVNIPLLIKYINKKKIKTVLTTHDCWAFTGYCPYFTIVKCEKWKTQCKHCPLKGNDKVNLLDNSRRMYIKKKELFTSVKDLTIVTPSKWINSICSESFLKDKERVVIHNGINLNTFHPTASAFRKKNSIPNGTILLLGVAFNWGIRKGLDVFIELAHRMDSEKYIIVLVGTDERIDKLLPDSVISIHQTNSQQELAEIYTAADLFVNPTREEMFGLVNVESLACGTPVLTFNSGGSPEIIDETCGSVVECDDIDALEKEIIRICEEKPYSQVACVLRAKEYDMNKRFEEYVELYREILQ